jgi:hypothetical protein
VTGRDLPPLSYVEEWMDFHDLTLRLSVETYERWCAAAAADGYSDDLIRWLRDLANERAAGLS